MSIPQSSNNQEFDFDIFLSHASEDKETVAKPLADLLKKKGLDVWLDEYQILVGDDFLDKINDGLSKSRFGVVILSKYFFSKKWTKSEVSALFIKEEKLGKVVLPVLHGVDYQLVMTKAPLLSTKKATSTSEGLDNVSEKIFEAIKPHLILLTNTEINNMREQIRWKRYHEGSYSDLDPLTSIVEKLKPFKGGDFYKCTLNYTELKLLLKISRENEIYVRRYDYGQLVDSEKHREDALNPILTLQEKLRYIIEVKRSK